MTAPAVGKGVVVDPVLQEAWLALPGSRMRAAIPPTVQVVLRARTWVVGVLVGGAMLLLLSAARHRR